MLQLSSVVAAGSPLVLAQNSLEAAAPPWWWYLAPVAAIASLVVAFVFYRWIMRQDEGTDTMRRIAQYVREGAAAYLKRQYIIVGVFFVVVTIVLTVMAMIGIQHALSPIAFLTGGLLSALAGYLGMKTATNASARTAHAARESLDGGLRVSFRGGAVMGLCVVGLALLGITAWFFYLTVIHHNVVGGPPMGLDQVAMVMLSMGLGASTMALFARVGGGIYTKAADVGADLVGKVEAGIPEDDPRNPATIADNVGDNVGDVAGMGADLFESYMGSILAASVLGVAAALQLGDDIEGVFARLAAPMLLAALGIGLSILGTYLVRTREGASMKQLMHALDRGIWAAAGLTIVAAGVLFWLLDLGWGPWGAVVTGLAVGLLIGRATEYYTSGDFGPTQKISASAEAGTGPLIISGLAWGMLSTWAPIVLVAVGTLVAFAINDGFGTGGHATGLYGVALAAVGMLSTLGITLATDAYGPIADNAGGNAEMSGLEPQVRERTDALDSLGNTTAAIGKGFAIGSAALTALALLAAYVEEVRVNIHREVADAQVEQVEGAAFAILDAGHGKYGMFLPPAGEDPDEVDRRDFTISLIASNTEDAFELPGWSEEGEPPHVIINRIGSGLTADRDDDAQGGLIAAPAAAATGRAGMNDYMAFYDVTLMNPKVLCGLLMGVMLVFVFSALTMQAVGRAAMAMVNEVRRQFAEKPGIMKGDDTPDYARCVLISTRGAQREMVVPSLLAISVPIAVGLVLDVAGVIGLLLGGLCAGYAMAVFMANAGGAWDNAKKLIETGEHGGKNSDAHRAAVVGDTVGDPFKDTAGPSLNILIKLMSMVSIVFAGLIVRFGPVISDWLGLS